MRRDPSLHPLSHQHQHGLALSVLIDRGLKSDPSPERLNDLAAKIATTWTVELQGHFQVEEEILFPAVRPQLADGAIVDDLIRQHRNLESLIQRIAVAQGDQRLQLVIEFGELLSQHIRIEERQLFEEIQARLTADQMAALGRQIEENVTRICPTTQKLPWDHSS
jgi:hemerythrin-like domain-containing protein